MKKLTKKQMIATGAVVVLGLGGITVGVVNHNHSVHAQQVAKDKAEQAKSKAQEKAKAEKIAKDKEAAQEREMATLLASATKNPSDNSIKTVNTAIAKLTDQKEKTKDLNLVKAINNRLSLIKKAQAAVKDYQAHATDASKQKAAQAAINNLKDKNDADVKAELQKAFNVSNKQAQDAAKALQNKQATEDKKLESQSKNNPNSTAPTTSTESGTDNNAATNSDVANNTATNNSATQSTPQTSNTSVQNTSGNTAAANTNADNSNSGASQSNNTNTGNTSSSSNTNSNNTGSNNSSNTGSSSAKPTPPATHVFQAWVKNKAGAVIWTQNCSTWDEATQAAANYGNSQFAAGNFDIGNYGVTQIS